MVNWKKVDDATTYVKETLAREADDIPQDLIDKKNWTLKTLDINDIKVNEEMIERHDKTEEHIGRRDSFIESIDNGTEILPLIALGDDKFLVDGYARYRALKKAGVNEIQVFVQE